jgi:hypothetical protein
MPIMAASDQNDVRGSARVLATTAKECIEKARATPKHVPVLNNLYRLLEAYRSHGFLGFEYEQRPARGPEALTLLPSAERHVGDLKAALDTAFHQVYVGQDRNHAVEAVESVLRAIAFPERKGPVPEADRKRASAFLGTFIDNLYAVR